MAFSANELVGRPTDRSITLKASADQAADAYVEYGTSSGSYSGSTATASFADGMIEIVVAGLSADARYFYRLRHRPSGTSEAFAAGPERTFRTQRARASSFSFAVQADSHQGFAPFYSDALYGTTLANIQAEQPDFVFDLGDTVSTDDAVETQASVRQKYLAQRNAIGSIGHSVPFFLVLGNHENEEGWNLDDTSNIANSLPVLGANARKRYFLNPVPSSFYSGNSDPLPQIDADHLRGDYYAFEWGNALFVAIDPFWYTTRKPYAGTTGGEKDDEVVGNRWDWTLGKTQYDWLAQTLTNSSASFKFVFAHHPTGGTSDYVRGGARGAKYCEWGGYDIDGTTWGFATQRPGWAMPVHNLLSEKGVTAFFHGHDHIYAKEDLDGVVYQEVPHAANEDYGSGFPSNQADYAGAVRVNNSGHVRVTVTPTLVSVAYVRSFLPGEGDNGSVGHAYVISPCTAAGSDGRVCDDLDACTATDRCAGGVCVGTAPLSCDDGNACTTDSCNPTNGCLHAHNTNACDDGNACTLVDRCSGGACVGAGAPACDDDNVCTTDSCNPARGCVYTNNTNGCSDDDACTTNDRCDDGACRGGRALDCDDDDVCTTDSCSAASGCVHANNTESCDDGNACTIQDACGAGLCAGVPRSCSPAGACRAAGTCDPANGSCTSPPLEDGTSCESGSCQAGVCVRDAGQGGDAGAAGQGGEAGAGQAGEGGAPVAGRAGGGRAGHGHAGHGARGESGEAGVSGGAAGAEEADAGEGGTSAGGAAGEDGGAKGGTHRGANGGAAAHGAGGVLLGATGGQAGESATAGLGASGGASGESTARDAFERADTGCRCSLAVSSGQRDWSALVLGLLGALAVRARRRKRLSARSV